MGQARQATGFGQKGDLIGHQYILYASIEKYRSIIEFLATNANRPQGPLPKGNHEAFLTFAVLTQSNVAAIQSFLHALHVGIKRIQIQHQRWDFDVREGVTQRCGRPWAHQIGPFKVKSSIDLS